MKRITEKISEYSSKFQTSLRKESERGSAIICATLLDESLYKLIKAKLVLSPERKDELLDGAYAPLSSFSAKIDFAYRLGLISLEQKAGFHLIRRVRNEFAHSSEELNFESAVIKDRIRELFRLNKGILDIFGNTIKLQQFAGKRAISLKDYESPDGLDFMLANVGFREVYELLGSFLAAGIQAKCDQIEHMEAFAPISPNNKVKSMSKEGPKVGQN